MTAARSILIFSTFFLLSFIAMAQKDLSYLALGDSYTIGEAVKSDQAWPSVLSKQLQKKDCEVKLQKIIATTGWTTDELLDAVEEDDDIKGKTFDLVSLLIGVNNQYRGYGIKQYEEEFELLLKKAISLAANKVGRVFVVSIPDYGVTQFAKKNDKNADLIAKELSEYNRIAKNISDEYGVHFFDITPISLKAQWSNSYIAKDDLHPSAKMYEEWVDYIAPGVYQLLK